MQVDVKHALIGQLVEQNALQAAEITQLREDLTAAHKALAEKNVPARSPVEENPADESAE